MCVCVCVSQKHTSPKFDLISVHGASAEGEVKVVLDLCQSWVQQKGVSFPRRPSRRPSSTGRQVWFSPQCEITTSFPWVLMHVRCCLCLHAFSSPGEVWLSNSVGLQSHFPSTTTGFTVSAFSMHTKF